jgi:hypothetical protein
LGPLELTAEGKPEQETIENNDERGHGLADYRAVGPHAIQRHKNRLIRRIGFFLVITREP